MKFLGSLACAIHAQHCLPRLPAPLPVSCLGNLPGLLSSRNAFWSRAGLRRAARFCTDHSFIKYMNMSYCSLYTHIVSSAEHEQHSPNSFQYQLSHHCRMQTTGRPMQTQLYMPEDLMNQARCSVMCRKRLSLTVWQQRRHRAASTMFSNVQEALAFHSRAAEKTQGC